MSLYRFHHFIFNSSSRCPAKDARRVGPSLRTVQAISEPQAAVKFDCGKKKESLFSSLFFWQVNIYSGCADGSAKIGKCRSAGYSTSGIKRDAFPRLRHPQGWKWMAFLTCLSFFFTYFLFLGYLYYNQLAFCALGRRVLERPTSFSTREAHRFRWTDNSVHKSPLPIWNRWKVNIFIFCVF